MGPIVDVHCHVLPGVDDGPSEEEESLAMLRLAYGQGVRKMILTPHYRRAYFETSRDAVRTAFAHLKTKAAREKIGMELLLGCEFHRDSEILDRLKEDNAYVMADTSYVLLEFSQDDSYSTIRSYTMGLLNSGYRPVIAHAERYPAIRRMEYIRDLTETGAYIQINAGSILGKEGFSAKRFCRKLLKEQRVHLVGSDAHGVKRRASCLGECAAYLEKKLGSREAQRILTENPEKLITNEYL